MKGRLVAIVVVFSVMLNAACAHRQTQRGRGALIGLGAGFVIGFAAARSAEPSSCTICDAQAGGANALLTMGLGAAAGAIIGTFIEAHKIVYEAPAAGSLGPPAPLKP